MNNRNWMFVFVYSSYHLNLQIVLNTPKNSRIKGSSRVKNHNFSKFEIFKWLNRANQELSLKKIPGNVFSVQTYGAQSFFYATYFNWSLTSLLSNHAIWQKSWSTSIVLAVFPWSLEVNASKEEKKVCLFSYTTPRWEKTTKSFRREWASKLAERDKGY